MSNSAVVASVAQALRDAELSQTAIAPIRPQLGGESADVDIAYAVQEVNTERALKEGRRLVGRKIGLTSKVVQAGFVAQRFHNYMILKVLIIFLIQN